ncbi:MAG: hypothetical protein FJX73_03780 [Armatimonadetes bacterium]|nr:hypothetical protein [Armatimonadota bacterium]
MNSETIANRETARGLETALVSEVKGRLQGLLGKVPFIRLKGWQSDARDGGSRRDLALNIAVDGERWQVLVEVKGSGEPRLIRIATQQLRAATFDKQRTYPVVAAPYISESSGEICREAGVGFVDLAGNCRLVFGKVFIEYRNFPNPRLERRPLRSLFAARASRVLRVLLEDVTCPWRVKTLALQAGVSIGLAFKVKQRFLDLEYGQEQDKGLRLTKPEELLRQWAANYSYRRSESLDCYGPGDPPELEEQLTRYCAGNDIRYALALFSGAARVAPFARYARGFSYVVTDPQGLAKRLGWKPVPSGANFTILRPYDDGLLYGVRKVGRDVVVGDVQLYLDLAGYKGRGEEAAQFLLEQRLRPQW